MITNELIYTLLVEEKIITEPPKKDYRLENRHFRNEFQLTSSDGKRRYSVFL
jgi:hypothetical protein